MDKNVERRYLQILKSKEDLKDKMEEKKRKYIKPLEEEMDILSLEEDEITLNEIKKVTETQRINLVQLTQKFNEKENRNE